MSTTLRKFRYSLNGGVSWSYVQNSLPFNIAAASAGDNVIVEPIGDAVSVAAVPGAAPSWVPRGPSNQPATMYLDAANDRGWFGETVYGSEALLLAAVNGTKSGLTRKIGPFVRGAEIVSNGGFDTDISGWNANYANQPIVWDAGRLKITNATGATAAIAFWANVPFDTKRAYQVGYNVISGSTNNRMVAQRADLVTILRTPIGPNVGLGAKVATMSARTNAGALFLRADSIPNTSSVIFDDVTAKEAVPFVGWNIGGYRQRVSARTPTSISATQVLMVTTDDLQIGGATGNTVQDRVRLEYRTDNHLHLIVTTATSQQCDVDLGAVALDTDFSVELRVGLTLVSARLNGGSYASATLAFGAPGVAVLRVGASSAGETWTGSIYGVAVWALGRTSIRFEGDSYIGGAGGVGMPLSYSAVADRIVTATGVGGSDMDGIKSRMLDANNAELLAATTVFWDGSPNGLTTVAAYCSLLQDCINALGHSRFVVIPPAIGDNTLKTQIRDEMLLRWPNNTYDWRPYILNAGGVIDATRFQSDGVHLNATGMGEAVTGLKAFMDARGL